MSASIRRLREAQKRKVMALIGPLLDAWDQVPNDMRCDLNDALIDTMRKIDEAMGGTEK